MASDDFSRPSDFPPPSDFNGREQSLSHFNDAEWVESYSSLYPTEQHPNFPPYQPQDFSHDDILRLDDLLSCEEILGQPPEDLWSINMQAMDNSQHDFQYQLEAPDPERLFDAYHVPPSSNPTAQTLTFPLTPPSSTRSGNTSPFTESVQNHRNFMDNLQQMRFGHPITPPNEVSIPNELSVVNENLLFPSTTQCLSHELTWSNEDSTKLLDPDLFPIKIDSFDNASNEQSMANSGWQYQTLVTPQSASDCFGRQQQGDWHNLTTSEPAYSYSQPSPPSNTYPADHTSANLFGAMQDHNFGTANQYMQQDTSHALSSLFEGLSPDVEPLTAGRRGSVKASQRASAKDRQLIEWKNQGLSYKEIKARGGFEEAESTLRGRYRTLTKPKHLRVRKPEWPDRDVEILLEAVDRHLQHHIEEEHAPERYSTEAQRRAAKVPWKQVAEYMEKRGCYRYGNATVKKKYLTVTGDPLQVMR